MKNRNRRDFLKASATFAAGTAVLKGNALWASSNAPVSPPASTRLSQFEYADVQLLDGPMLEQFHQNVTLFLNLNDDSLLKPFRQLAG
jgi:hypothetical protein